MNMGRVDQIAKAILYEGYMLYPYRPSSVKNRQRFNFGVVYPKAFSDAQGDTEPSMMQIECLVRGNPNTTIEVRLRFLHLRVRAPQMASASGKDSLPDNWQEAVEREVAMPRYSFHERNGLAHAFSLRDSEQSDDGRAYRQAAVEGTIELGASRIEDGCYKVYLQVRNTTPMSSPAISREEALMHALVSTHVVLGVEGGEFVSLLDPPAGLEELASECQNVGAWPVLVGEPGQRDTLLASPIILYDYPQIAPESAGDLFDGTEIDEILSLRIMTLTDEEKREIRQSDDRARQILERTENMPVEQFLKLHGVVRGLRPLKENP